MLTAVVCVNGNAQFICLVLPDGARRRVIMVVDGVVEVHDPFLVIPVQTIGKLNAIWAKKLHMHLSLS